MRTIILLSLLLPFISSLAGKHNLSLTLQNYVNPTTNNTDIRHVSKCPSGLCERPGTLLHRLDKPLPVWPDDFSWKVKSPSPKKYTCISLLQHEGFWCQRRNTKWYGWSSSPTSTSTTSVTSFLWMDPSSSLSSTIAYVVDPKKEEKKTCIPFTSHGYLCVRTVGGKPCTVGTVRTSGSKDAYDREHDRTTHTHRYALVFVTVEGLLCWMVLRVAS